jgi:hypothetical protein
VVNGDVLTVKAWVTEIMRWSEIYLRADLPHLLLRNGVVTGANFLTSCMILIVVFPCILIITQLLFQQNALVY